MTDDLKDFHAEPPALWPQVLWGVLMIALFAAAFLLGFLDGRDEQLEQRQAPQPRETRLVVVNADTWNALQATSVLAHLMSEGCIEWQDVNGRHRMTCGDTVPAVKVASLAK